MLLRTIAFHTKNLISKSSAVKTMPTQVWVGWTTLLRQYGTTKVIFVITLEVQ